jgi:hypothetical protein
LFGEFPAPVLTRIDKKGRRTIDSQKKFHAISYREANSNDFLPNSRQGRVRISLAILKVLVLLTKGMSGTKTITSRKS